MKQALIFSGGWDGHKPDELSRRYVDSLSKHNFQVQVEKTQEVLQDRAALDKFDLIIPCWTMGKLEGDAGKNLGQAIDSGIGLGGIHGGMGDAFRGNIEYEWMTGGIFVGHPHVGPYTVYRTVVEHPITDGLPAEFPYESEQYYMMVDPGITVLAETTYIRGERGVTMPVVWVKRWGKGRVFYSALGHDPVEFDKHPHVWEMTIRGLLWAAR